MKNNERKKKTENLYRIIMGGGITPMNIWGNIQKRLQNLPGIRRPAKDSLYDLFMQDYGWSFQKSNKPDGDLHVYYNALNNVYVSQCIQVYCDESLNAGFNITNQDTEVTDESKVNYLTQLFNDPQGKYHELTFAMLNSQIWTSWLATGDCFIEVNHDEVFDNIPIGFKYVPTELICYFEDTDQWGLRNTEYRYEQDELIHIYQPGVEIRNNRWGKSVIDKIGLSIALEFLGMKHNKEIFEDNGIDPRGILSFDPEVGRAKAVQEIERIKNNKNKKGLLAVIGANYQRTNNTNRDMDFLNLMTYSRDRIITAFGVQPSKIGVRETASLGSGTGESQDKDFKKTLSGKCKIIEGQFNKVLGRNGFNEVFQYNEIDIEDKQKRAEIEDKQLRNGTMFINEVRSGYGLEPVDWGNVPMNYSQFALASSPENLKEVEPITPATEVKALKKALLMERLNKEY